MRKKCKNCICLSCLNLCYLHIKMLVIAYWIIFIIIFWECSTLCRFLEFFFFEGLHHAFKGALKLLEFHKSTAKQHQLLKEVINFFLFSKSWIYKKKTFLLFKSKKKSQQVVYCVTNLCDSQTINKTSTNIFFLPFISI